MPIKDGFELKAVLTKRERQVMRMILDGHDHNEISQKLGFGYESYRAHHNNILHKLQLKSDMELARFADKHIRTDDY